MITGLGYFSFYRIFDMSGALVARPESVTLPIAQSSSYSLVAIFLCLSFFPLALTNQYSQLCLNRPYLCLEISPIAVAGVLVVGATGAAIRMIGPLLYSADAGQRFVFSAIYIRCAGAISGGVSRR